MAEEIFLEEVIDYEKAEGQGLRGMDGGVDFEERVQWDVAHMGNAHYRDEPNRFFEEGLAALGVTRAKGVDRPLLKTGIWRLDAALEGGLATGVLCEAVCPQASGGGQSFLLHLLDAARREGRFVVLADGSDCFDPQTAPPVLLEHLLWARCSGAKQCLKVLDTVLRDENLGMAIADFRGCEWRELRRVQSSEWYRMQRLAGHAGMACVALTPKPLIPSAQVRFAFDESLGLGLCDEGAEEIAKAMRFEVMRNRKRDDGAFRNLVTVGF